jgi:hypothetical protein
MSEPGIRPVGWTFTDGDGCERVKTPFGFNAYVTRDGAITGAVSIGAPGTTWYIWRLADGSYDFTATGNPDIPGHPAELVETITVKGRGERKEAVPHA